MREVNVQFISQKLKDDFLRLEKGKNEDKRLYEQINRVFDNLKNNPFCGIKIPKKLWPKEYIKMYKLTNLWKYDLPDAWRLIYTVEADEVRIVSIVLDWLDHKHYERKFKY